jgi:hypothetical protein
MSHGMGLHSIQKFQSFVVDEIVCLCVRFRWRMSPIETGDGFIIFGSLCVADRAWDNTQVKVP